MSAEHIALAPRLTREGQATRDRIVVAVAGEICQHGVVRTNLDEVKAAAVAHSFSRGPATREDRVQPLEHLVAELHVKRRLLICSPA